MRPLFVIPYHRKQAKITVHPTRSSHIQRNYDNDAPGTPSILPLFGSTLTFHSFLVNDVVVHPNQGELISCDQAGRIKQWDLSENTCTHELVSLHITPLFTSVFPEHSLSLPVVSSSDSCRRHTYAFRKPRFRQFLFSSRKQQGVYLEFHTTDAIMFLICATITLGAMLCLEDQRRGFIRTAFSGSDEVPSPQQVPY